MFNPFFHPLRQALLNYTPVNEGPALIKSIQHYLCTIPAMQASVSQAITAVDLNYSVIVFAGHDALENDACYFLAKFSFLDDSNILFDRNVFHLTLAITGSAFVVEFNPFAIKSIQEKAACIYDGQTQADKTINEVDLNKSILLHSGVCSNSITTLNFHLSYIYFLNSTTVRCVRSGTLMDAWHRFFVLEFN